MTSRQSVPKAVARQVILRDKGKCQLCKEIGGVPVLRYGHYRVVKPPPGTVLTPWQHYNGPVVDWIEIDHIKPVCLGGTNDLDNLRLACRKCNRKKNYIVYMKEVGLIPQKPSDVKHGFFP